MNKTYRRAITYGTFDLFHVGHLNLLTKISELAEEVAVAVSTDEFNSIKGKRTIVPFRERLMIVGALRCVTTTFPEDRWDQKRDDIGRERADVLVMGDDWAGRFDDLADLCDVIYLPRTPGISSTELKELVSSEVRNEVVVLFHQAEGLYRSLKTIVERR